MSKWISVKDRLPESEGMVLVYAKSQDPKTPLIVVTHYAPGEGFCGLVSVWADVVSHWMPLPAPPKE